MTPQNQGKLASIGEIAKTRRIWRGEFGEIGEHEKSRQKTQKKVVLKLSLRNPLTDKKEQKPKPKPKPSLPDFTRFGRLIRILDLSKHTTKARCDGSWNLDTDFVASSNVYYPSATGR